MPGGTDAEQCRDDGRWQLFDYRHQSIWHRICERLADSDHALCMANRYSGSDWEIKKPVTM